jgi:hypothetical protein
MTQAPCVAAAEPGLQLAPPPVLAAVVEPVVPPVAAVLPALPQAARNRLPARPTEHRRARDVPRI